MCSVVDQLPANGRKIVVVAVPGDRRDEDVRQVAAKVAGHFDIYICRRDDALRGREPSEIPEMLAEALRAEGVLDESIQVVPSEVEAVDRSLRIAEKDDLVLIFGDKLQRTWEQITRFHPDTPHPAASDEVTAPRVDLPDLPQGDMDVGGRVMRDERGVYLAPEFDD
jgi:cyanophycin synthetase